MKHKVSYNYLWLPLQELPDNSGRINFDCYCKFCIVFINSSGRNLDNFEVEVVFNHPALITKVRSNMPGKVKSLIVNNKASTRIDYLKKGEKLNIDISVGNWEEGTNNVNLVVKNPAHEISRSRVIRVKEMDTRLIRGLKKAMKIGFRFCTKIIWKGLLKGAGAGFLATLPWLGVSSSADDQKTINNVSEEKSILKSLDSESKSDCPK